ncbi:hypothetical protein QZH41_001752 [Actinostola sp. cb2023]|nr:hypothetical protein QZH41_001752 [Actinostola sp. cb2023]
MRCTVVPSVTTRTDGDHPAGPVAKTFDNGLVTLNRNAQVQTVFNMYFNVNPLQDGWYQLGSSAFKHFKTKKTWKDANDTCSANKASLATINSELENRFVAEVFLKTFQGYKNKV